MQQNMSKEEIIKIIIKKADTLSKSAREVFEAGLKKYAEKNNIPLNKILEK